MTTCRFSVPAIGDRVRMLGAFLDEDWTIPVVGTVQGVLVPPDSREPIMFVVRFEHDDPWLPPGGEFTADRLAPAV